MHLCINLIAISLTHCLQDDHLGTPHTLEYISPVIHVNSGAGGAKEREDHLRGLCGGGGRAVGYTQER